MIRARFLCAVPRAQSPTQFPARVPSPETIRADRAALWIDEKTSLCPLSDHGLAVGVLFDRSTYRPLDRLAGRMDTLEALADHLLTRSWGAYAAIVSEPESDALSVLVDPSGLLPVYCRAETDHIVVTTDPALIEAKPSYPDIASHLLRPELRHRRTCLEAVDELPPGSIKSLTRPRDPPRQLWQAADHFPSGSAPAFGDAAEILRELTGRILGSWAGAFGPVGVAASGGVDSSLVCAALAHAGAPFDCITVAAADRSGDERLHARAVANWLGVRCLERAFDAKLFDPCESASRGLARPARRAFLAVFDRILEDARRELRAEAVWDGNNGDNLFCYLHSAAPIVDRLRTEGMGAGVFQTLFAMCRITDCSLATMTAATARRLVRTGLKESWPADTRLLADDVVHAGSTPLAPGPGDGAGPRSGKHDHLILLMHAQNHLNGITGPLARFSPLASQPLVEFCLGLPSWLWATGGRNRAVARAAFADSLPPAILARTSKAGPDSFIRLAFAHHRTAIRERLLDGLLASHGVLDRLAVERAMQIDEFRDALLVDRIFDLLEAENWARSWGG